MQLIAENESENEKIFATAINYLAQNKVEVKDLLESKFNRELMMEYLDMDAEELTELLNECNYSDYFIKEASDLQLIEAVLLCYENYKAIKKGSTIKVIDKQ